MVSFALHYNIAKCRVYKEYPLSNRFLQKKELQMRAITIIIHSAHTLQAEQTQGLTGCTNEKGFSQISFITVIIAYWNGLWWPLSIN